MAVREYMPSEKMEGGKDRILGHLFLYEHMTLGVANSGQGAPLTRAVGALLRALASSRRACLKNPRDWGAWWAAVYGVAQSQTLLK